MKMVKMMLLLMAVLTGLLCFAVAKPEKVVNVQVQSDKDAIAELGDYTSLTNAIMTANNVSDLKPILMKLAGAAYSTPAGKDKKNKK